MASLCAVVACSNLRRHIGAAEPVHEFRCLSTCFARVVHVSLLCCLILFAVSVSPASPTPSPTPTPTATPTLTPTPTPTTSYYVDSISGSDGNSGLQSSPWRTIQKAMNSATAGSTVNIKGGTYHERLALNVSGTAGNYITFQPAGYDGTGCGASIAANGYVTCSGDQVILDYAYLGTVTGSDYTPFLNINNRSYVKIQGLTFQN